MDWPIPKPIVAVLAALFLIFVYKLYFQRRLFKDLPGPPHHPLLGHLPVMAEVARSLPADANPQMYAHYIREKYQLGRIFYLDFWPLTVPQLVIVDPDVAAQVAQQGSFDKGEFVRRFLGPLVGENAMVAANGTYHKLTRTVFNPGFSVGNIMMHVPTIVDDVLGLCNVLKRHAMDGDIFPLENATTRLIFDIQGHVVLDCDFNAQRSENVLMTAFLEQGRLLPVDLLSRYLIDLNPRSILSRWKNTRIMDKLLGDILERRFAQRRNEKQRISGRDFHVVDLGFNAYYKDSVSQQSANTDTLDPACKSLFITQIKTFLFAGHDSSSSTICYIFHFMSRHPDALRKVREEHDEVFGCNVEDAARLLKQEPRLLNKLHYTMAVIKETLRIFPPIGGSYRSGKKGVNIIFEGKEYPTYPFAPYINVHAMQHHPDLFPYPEAFIPERYLVSPPDALAVPPNTWRAFEKGSRNCIGEALAIVQTKVIMALTMRSFAVEERYEGLGEMIDGERMYQVLQVTAKPKDGMPARVRLVEKGAAW